MSYTLVCIVIGERSPFTVKVDKTQPVEELKEEIKKKRPNVVDDATHNATHLALYKAKINISNRANYIKELQAVYQDPTNLRKTRLDSLSKLSEYFKRRPS